MNAIELLPKLIRACFEGDRKTTETVSLMVMRKIRKEYPETAAEIAKALSYAGYGSNMARSIDLAPLPVDRESRSSLVKLDEPKEIPTPILDEYVCRQLDDFLQERSLLETFLQEDIVPPNSLLLSGAPGVGKTYIAKWISYKLNLPLVTLDLGSAISSYLGRSGQNIQAIFNYAKSQDAILFLDELDAIAKRRDDAGDLGELKRLVNVLLKELEECPSSCVIIGATNHPELLDKAIWRRFDRTLVVPMPVEAERSRLLQRQLGRYYSEMGKDVLEYLVKSTNDVNAADICKLCEHIKRQVIMNPEMHINLVALSERFKTIELKEREEKVSACKTLKNSFPQLKQRDIAYITRIPLTSVSRYLGKKEV